MNDSTHPVANGLTDVLAHHAGRDPERLAYRFLVTGSVDGPVDTLTYGQLHQKVRAAATALIRAELQGERALLLFPAGLDFVVGFLACLHAGVVAVPAHFPDKRGRLLPRLQAIGVDCAPAIILTTSGGAATLERLGPGAPLLAGLPRLAIDALGCVGGFGPERGTPATPSPNLAFLQYTSGSTGAPKGVRVTHANLAANALQIASAMGVTRDTRGLSWLPPCHDMGLIGGVLQTLWYGAQSTLMAPEAFLRNPLSWLRAISSLGISTSGGPNFAYDLCARKAENADLSGLDLSSWRVAFNGAEPVRQDTIDRFQRVFTRVGFRSTAMFPCYGLAEATLLASGGPAGRGPGVLEVDATALEQLSVRPLAGGRPLPSSGVPAIVADLTIVDPDTKLARPAGHVGEVWLRGPQVADGYWARPDESRETFNATRADTGEAGHLRTGDLGFLHDGRLYVTGRRKDLIIVRGRNLWPQDIERFVERRTDALRAAGCAAFALDTDGGERIAVVCEVASRRGSEWSRVAADVRAAVAGAFEVATDLVALIAPHALPKTSSGKVRRAETRRLLERGALPVLAHAGRLPGTDARATAPPAGQARHPALSVMFFSSDASNASNASGTSGTSGSDDAYALFREVTQFADAHGFEAIWIPERHFHGFGGLFPNPSVLAAAVAASTSRIHVRAGSVVMPLHDPLRVAEEWAVVDRLSRGRAGVAFASGWNPNDFALAPEHHADRVALTHAGMDTVRRLWRGESITRRNGLGKEAEIRVFPRPETELPLWLTCASNPERFAEAGSRGFHLLTALLFQTPEELAERIQVYREARRTAGFDPATGRVTLMMHTFVAATDAEVDRAVAEPLRRYLESSVDLWRQGAEALDTLPAPARAEVLAYAARRYRSHNALIGTPAQTLAMLQRVRRAGVDEVACLVDFGVESAQVLPSLGRLDAAVRRHADPETPYVGEERVGAHAVPAPLQAATPHAVGDLTDRICRMAQEALELAEPIDPDTPLSAMGLDSLSAVELSQQLAEALGRPIGAAFWFDHPTARSAAEHLLRPDGASATDAATDAAADDLLADARLPADIQVRRSHVAAQSAPRRILLTGATGFLGAFLLRELLDRSDAQLLCLVRAHDVAQGRDRLLRNLATYGLERPDDGSRIEPLLGDLAAPGLGQADEVLGALANAIDIIVHNGAIVHFAKPYSALRAPNVLGTLEVLRLACRGERAIPVHFVSTMAVFSPAYAGTTVHPSDTPEDHARLDMGYSRSKWVADRLAQQARARGLPVSIHRPGLVTGDARTGACHQTNFIWNLIKASVQTGVIPDYDRVVDMTPVDWVARQIARDALDPAGAAAVRHLANPRPTSLFRIRDHFAAQGYELQTVPFERWQIRVMQSVVGDDALRPLLPVISLAAADFYERSQVRHDSAEVAAGFEQRGDPCPAADHHLLDTYRRAFVASGFLAPPRTTRKPIDMAQALSWSRLHPLAAEITGVSDLGGTPWQASMEVLLQDMRRQAYRPGGVDRATTRLLLTLVRRARVLELHRRNAEVRATPIEAPVFIVAPPRTGTTLLHNLLALDPGHRAFSLAELINPVTPAQASAAWSGHMRDVAEAFVQETYERSPALRAIHPLAADAPDECQWILSAHASLVQAIAAYAPGYASWVLEHDMSEAYAFHRQAWQALAWRRPGGRIIAKDPWHLWHLDALFAAYPDATVIRLHRDMAEAVPSLCSLAMALQGVEAQPAAPEHWGRFCLDLLTEGVARAQDARKGRESQFIDVRYTDLVRDPVSEVRRIYARLGRPCPPALCNEMSRWVLGHPTGQFGRHRYDLATFGLTREAIASRFDAYAQRHRLQEPEPA